MTACRHVFVRGRVQGVAFRWSAADEARRLGVDGWVRNLSDGRVETWIQGPADRVSAMVAWLGHGPSAARVDDLQVTDASPDTLEGFEIRPTSHA